MSELNIQIFYYLNSLASRAEWFDQTVVFVAGYFGIILLLGLLAFLALHRHEKSVGIKNIFVVLSAALFAWIIARALKYSLPVPRPFEALPDVNKLLDYGGGDSFPSGHATFFGALAVAVFFYHRTLGMLYIVGALLIGLARVVAGIHFPVDILAGYIIGGAVAYIAYKYYNK